jgi:hypothetical protein
LQNPRIASAGNLQEGAAGSRGCRQREIRMVQLVEHFEPQLRFEPLLRHENLDKPLTRDDVFPGKFGPIG